tara:strand:- start:538 stop:945 length:408 start_codon:yes stop_codon:yes gene_type:complete
MPRIFIPTLNEITEIADGDLFIVSNIDVNQTEKITFAVLKAAILGTLGGDLTTLQDDVNTLQGDVTTLQNDVDDLDIPTLNEITTIANGDLFIVNNISIGQNRNITLSDLRAAILGTLQNDVNALDARVTALENP